MRRSYYRSSSENALRYQCVCEECGSEFVATRDDALYCSNRCKCKAAYRRRVAGVLAEATQLGIRTAQREFKKIAADVKQKKAQTAKR